MPRSKKFDEESAVITFRVPKSKADRFKKAIQNWINKKMGIENGKPRK